MNYNKKTVKDVDGGGVLTLLGLLLGPLVEAGLGLAQMGTGDDRRSLRQVRFSPDCWLFFGKETAGLPRAFRERHRDRCIRIPMADACRR